MNVAGGAPVEFIDELHFFGKQLFGKPSRLRLGVWIAALPGHGPRTFCQTEYVDYLDSKEWRFGNERITLAADLRRFAACNMLQYRPELSNTKRIKHWTRLESPLWDVFLIAGIVLGEHLQYTAAERRRVLHELIALRDALHNPVPREGRIA